MKWKGYKGSGGMEEKRKLLTLEFLTQFCVIIVWCGE
jgi:hypothetical protein